MRVTRRELRLIIREMAYKGTPNVIASDSDHWAYGGSLGSDNYEGPHEITDPEYREKMKKFFTGKKFQKQATHFYGETRAFPDSNVWVIPFIGNEHAAYRTIETGNESDFREKSSDKEWSKSVPGIASVGGGGGDRFVLIPLDHEKLRNIGHDDVEGVDLGRDIVIMPIASVLLKYNMPTVHMIIHAIFDSEIRYSHSSRLPVTISLYEDLEGHVGDDHYTLGGKTRAFRDANIPTKDDAIAEIFTGALLYGYEDIDADIYDFKSRISKSVAEIRQLLAGNILLITVA
tara:strand:- start:16002 stop:16865 length:864 start_codon:yes stop_codon:yes gene_type:complete